MGCQWAANGLPMGCQFFIDPKMKEQNGTAIEAIPGMQNTTKND